MMRSPLQREPPHGGVAEGQRLGRQGEVRAHDLPRTLDGEDPGLAAGQHARGPPPVHVEGDVADDLAREGEGIAAHLAQRRRGGVGERLAGERVHDSGHRELVPGQRARLVGADHLDGAQRLDGVQALHEDVLLRKALGTHGQRERGQEALGHVRDDDAQHEHHVHPERPPSGEAVGEERDQDLPRRVVGKDDAGVDREAMRRQRDAHLLLHARHEGPTLGEQLLQRFVARIAEPEARRLADEEHVEMAEIGAQQAQERDRMSRAVRVARERQEHAAGLAEHTRMNDTQGDDPESPGPEQARRHGPREEREVPHVDARAADERRLVAERD